LVEKKNMTRHSSSSVPERERERWATRKNLKSTLFFLFGGKKKKKEKKRNPGKKKGRGFFLVDFPSVKGKKKNEKGHFLSKGGKKGKGPGSFCYDACGSGTRKKKKKKKKKKRGKGTRQTFLSTLHLDLEGGGGGKKKKKGPVCGDRGEKKTRPQVFWHFAFIKKKERGG